MILKSSDSRQGVLLLFDVELPVPQGSLCFYSAGHAAGMACLSMGNLHATAACLMGQQKNNF